MNKLGRLFYIPAKTDVKTDFFCEMKKNSGKMYNVLYPLST